MKASIEMSKSQSKQVKFTLPKEKEELKRESDDDHDNSQNSSVDSVTSKRGRPSIPEKWTRVYKINDNGPTVYRTYNIATDLLLGSALSDVPRSERMSKNYKILFMPSQYTTTH